MGFGERSAGLGVGLLVWVRGWFDLLAAVATWGVVVSVWDDWSAGVLVNSFTGNRVGFWSMLFWVFVVYWGLFWCLNPVRAFRSGRWGLESYLCLEFWFVGVMAALSEVGVTVLTGNEGPWLRFSGWLAGFYVLFCGVMAAVALVARPAVRGWDLVLPWFGRTVGVGQEATRVEHPVWWQDSWLCKAGLFLGSAGLVVVLRVLGFGDSELGAGWSVVVGWLTFWSLLSGLRLVFLVWVKVHRS